MKDTNITLPADIGAIKKFLAKHDLSDYDSMKVLSDTPKDVRLELDFGDDEIVTVNIRRRKGTNGNYRITYMG